MIDPFWPGTRALSHVRSVTYGEWARFASEMQGSEKSLLMFVQ